MLRVNTMLSCLALVAFAAHAGLGVSLVWPASMASLVVLLCLLDILAGLSSWAEIEVDDRQQAKELVDCDIEFRQF